MKFEELQSLWDCQDKGQEKPVDAEVVLDSVRHRSQKMGIETSLFEWILIGTLIFVGLTAMRKALMHDQDIYRVATGLLCMGSAAYIWRGRWQRRRDEIQFDDSMLGVIEKTIAQLNYKASQMRMYIWFCMVPLSANLVVGYLRVEPAKHIWYHALFIPLFVFMMGLSFFVMRWEVQKMCLPQLAELEAQRAKLLESDEEST